MAKVTDHDIRDAFDHRESIGKLELTTQELADILTKHYLDEGESITRQAVDARLSNGVDGIAETTHGRQKQFYLTEDREQLFADGGYLQLSRGLIAGFTVALALASIGFAVRWIFTPIWESGEVWIIGAVGLAVLTLIFRIGVLESSIPAIIDKWLSRSPGLVRFLSGVSQ